MIVEHEESRRRFVADIDGEEAELRYGLPDAHTIDLQHTSVPEHARGGGVGEALADAAFSYARAQGLRVIPTCPFLQSWLEHHPEQRDLLVGAASPA